jgi:hypothetical protein
MSLSRLIQAATSAGIAAVAALALFFGAEVVLFDTAVRRLDAAAAVPAPGGRTQWVEETDPTAGPEAAAALAGWQATPGVGGAARTILATRTVEHVSLPQRLLEITKALSVAPTNGAQWLAFADATLRLGYGTDHALLAYDMATLTARREGDQMFLRALLVLRTWEEMPDELRQAAMGQLGEVRGQLKEAERKSIATIVAAKTPQVRAEIAEALPAKLGGDKRFIKQVGL